MWNKCFLSRLLETVQELARLDSEAMTQENVITVLEKGLKAFGELEKKWTEMTQFFETMLEKLYLQYS